MNVAFFDLDRTLIDANSGILWARYEREAGHLSRLAYLKGLVWGIRYHFSLIDIEAAFQSALKLYRGIPEETLRSRTRIWFQRDISHRLRPGAQAIIDHHRSRGEKLVLLTNSSIYAAEAAAETWGFDHWIANRLPLDERGGISGGIDLPLCYGQGKVTRSLRWLQGDEEALAQATFYTDSYSDLPMLEAVRFPRVVHPDPKLRRHAKRAGWPIFDWSSTL